MLKQLTISVAAYNVEAYLDNLMNSIIQADTMESIEVLIINDGSMDNTAKIAKVYQERFPQSVRLINKPNGGHGSAINRGIEEATGKYFRALDGDDWVNPEHLSELVKKLESIDSDIILSDYCMCYEDGRRELPDEFPDLKDGEVCHFDEIWHPGFWMRYHTVIYKTEILKKNKIQLDEHCFYVDVEFMLYPIPFINTVYYFKNYIYCYRVGIEGQSVSDSSRMKNIAQSDKVGRHLIKYYNNNNEFLSEQKRQYFIDEMLFHCKWHEESLFLFPLSKSKKQAFMDFENYINEHAPEVFRLMSEESKVLTILRKTGYLPYHLATIYRKMKRKRQ